MRRLSLTSMLIALNAGLLLVAVVGVAAGAVRVVRQLADRQALARVDLAAQSAAAAIDRAGDRVLASARLAADRPALGRILSAGDRAALGAWLERFRRTSELTGCALFVRDVGGAGGRRLASAGPPLPWETLRRPEGGRSLVTGTGGTLILGGSATLAAAPQVEAVTARALDEAFTRRLGGQVGLAVTVLDSRDAGRAAAPAARLRERAMAAGAGGPARPVTGAGGMAAGQAAAGASGSAAGPAAGAGVVSSGTAGGPAAGAASSDTAAEPAAGAVLTGTAAETAAARVDAEEMYVADRALLGPAGEVVGVVETRLPVATVEGSLASLSRRLMLLALAVAAVAIAASAAVGRRLGRPVRRLTASAARLGRGDLTTPIDKAPGIELGALAATLEETRRQLLRLTAELRRRQAEGEAVLTGIAEGVLSVDRDRRIRYLNPQAAALLGIRAEEALGRFCGDVLDPRGAGGERPCEDGCPIVHARFRGSARAAEHLRLAGGGRRSVVITSAGPVEDRQFLVMRDETEVELARRQRDTVLANISHEFKTPLAAQRASLEMLRDKLLDRRAAGQPEGGGTAGAGVAGRAGAGEPGRARAEAAVRAATGAAGRAGADGDEIQELVLSLERGGLRLAQLIDNLLESVRIESGQDSLRRRPVALDEVVEEAVELTAALFAQRRQRVEVDLPYPLPAVLGDAPRLTQVFVNLLANGQKFAPAGSPLAIGGEVTAEQVVLWVDDQGPGLPPMDDSGRELFRRFVRSPGELAEPEQSGMGLGLWIVQSIVERHGGTVEAERRPVGTRMRVALPRGSAAAGGDAAGATAAGEAAAGEAGEEAAAAAAMESRA